MFKLLKKSFLFCVLTALMIVMISCGSGTPVAPDIPPVVQKVAGPDEGAVINEATALFQWIGNDATGGRLIVRYEIKKDGGSWQTNTPLIGTTYMWNNMTEGAHTFSVRAVDNRGNTSNILTWDFNYTLVQYTLSVQADPITGGDIQIESQGWKDTDTITVDVNTPVDLGAQPLNGYQFEGWYEGQTLLSQNAVYTVTVDRARTLTGVFTEIPNPVPTVQKNDGPDGGAVINLNNATFEWSGTDESRAIVKYQYQKDAGAWTDMTPVTATAYTWNNIVEGAHTFSVKAFDDEEAQSDPVTWTFTYTIPEYTLTAQASPAIGGDIQIAAQGWEDTDTITVDENTQVELNAQAAEGYEFDGWYEGQTLLSQQETYTAAVDTNQTIVAQFQQLTRLRDLGPEGNTNEAGNVYNILDNTMLGYWSVSIKTTRLPEEFQGASEWKIIVLGEEYTFSPNFLVADIYETNVEDTITEDIEDIRNAFFVAVF